MPHRNYTVAVDDDLTPVREALERRGYQVVDTSNFRQAHAVVLRGDSENLMGIQNTETSAPVITANGRTPDEVVREIEQKLQIQDGR